MKKLKEMVWTATAYSLDVEHTFKLKNTEKLWIEVLLIRKMTQMQAELKNISDKEMKNEWKRVIKVYKDIIKKLNKTN